MSRKFYLISSVALVVAMAVSILYMKQPKTGPLGESGGIPFEFTLTMISTGCVAVFCFIQYLQHGKDQ